MIITKKICLFAVFLAFIVTLLSASPLLVNDLVDNSACITSDGFSSSYNPFQVAVTPTGNPEAEDDSYTIYEDNPLIVLAPGVLGNDHDVDGDILIAMLDTMPSQGLLNFFDDGSFIYIPAPNFFGVDFFTYHASDFLLDSNIATVMIEVLPVNDAPVALDDEFVMYEDTSLTIPAPLLLSNDNDPDGDFSLAVIDSFPSFGLLEIVSDQEFIYTPFPDWYGIDSFSYRITDGIEYSSVAVVTIIVLDVIDDTTPPTTTISLAGTLGANGWYISDVVVTLTATDDLSTFSTMYSLDDTNWFSYTGPFTIAADGFNTVYYYSIDTVGNEELTKSNVIIIDTDITGPIITITYTGDSTDGSPGYWTVTAVDPESGISSVTVEIDGVLVGTLLGDYLVPNDLGLHTIRVNATNADDEVGIEDQEFSTLSETVTIVDDDTTGPLIAIVHSGGTTDSDSGVWTVTVSDPESGIITLIVEINGELAGTTAGEYAVPAVEGTHTITVTAYNGDLDRGEIDQEMSVESASITITSESTPGWVTGGGWIIDANGNKGHFAFVVKLKPNGDIFGVFVYSLKIGKWIYMVKSTDFLEMAINGNHAYFEAKCSVLLLNLHNCRVKHSEDGYMLRVDVWENPGRHARDIFQIRIYDSSGQVWYEAGFDPIGYVHGAIVIHEYKRMKGCQSHHG